MLGLPTLGFKFSTHIGALVALGEALLLQTNVSIKLKLRFMLDSLSMDSLVLFPG
jgi:hypothetical protein